MVCFCPKQHNKQTERNVWQQDIMPNNEIYVFSSGKGDKSSGAIKLACHQELCKARFVSNFGPEATGRLQITAFTRKHVKCVFLHVNTLTWMRCIMYSCASSTFTKSVTLIKLVKKALF